MFEGNWKCAGCGGTITELPFQPRSEEGLTCRDCFSKQKQGGEGNAQTNASAGNGERKMFQGEWKCSGCGNAITQLPFEPRNTENLKCIDCFKQSRA